LTGRLFRQLKPQSLMLVVKLPICRLLKAWIGLARLNERLVLLASIDCGKPLARDADYAFSLNPGSINVVSGLLF
jgi:hypothetical protein